MVSRRARDREGAGGYPRGVRRALLIAVFATLLAGVLVGLHAYLIRRLILDPGLAAPWRQLGIAAIAGLGSTLVLQPIGERLLRPPLSRALAWPASLWMGFAFLLLVPLAASDALLWLGTRAARAASAHPGPALAAPGARAAAVACLALVAGGFGLRDGLRRPASRRVEIRLARWPRALDGFRIAQISDLHIGPILGRSFAAHLVAVVNRLDADLVAVTGDLVDGSVRLLADEVAPLAGLRGRHGVFFVTGNHDHLSGADAWAAAAAGLGMRVLRNERVEISHAGIRFDLAGVDDAHGRLAGGSGGEDLERALAGRDASRPLLLLAHDPSTFKRSRAHGVSLQLSGHTHGGQIWPFRWLVRLAIPYVSGLFRDGDCTLYVSRGTGFWGPPMRLFAPAEITELVLRSA
jgi:predicted MPP superfamily phosphohydrolase